MLAFWSLWHNPSNLMINWLSIISTYPVGMLAKCCTTALPFYFPGLRSLVEHQKVNMLVFQEGQTVHLLRLETTENHLWRVRISSWTSCKYMYLLIFLKKYDLLFRICMEVGEQHEDRSPIEVAVQPVFLPSQTTLACIVPISFQASQVWRSCQHICSPRVAASAQFV